MNAHETLRGPKHGVLAFSMETLSRCIQWISDFQPSSALVVFDKCWGKKRQLKNQRQKDIL